jgi:two-component system sensor histidine kinase AlgZ
MMSSIQPVLMRRAVSTNCVADQPHKGSRPAASELAANSSYLPDFAASANVLILLVIAQTVALMLSLVRDYPSPGFAQSLGETSLFILFIAVSAAWLLAAARSQLVKFSVTAASVLTLAIVLGNTVVISEVVFWFGQVYGDPSLQGPASMFPQDRWAFVSRNLLITLVVGLAVMRYFYVTHQWRSNVEAVAESRFNALQARIRPHFLFNSMNTIAALIRRNPDAAERAVEDLADLFRASLGNPDEPVSLQQELEVARVYQRMEQQRLGERLDVEWQMADVPLQTSVPALTIQPLLENAIYHGIEPLADGGLIRVFGSEHEGTITITVINPLAPIAQRRNNKGHQIALDNIRQRLELAYGGRARLEVEEQVDEFRVLISFPVAV